jgi:diguanylate cyclase (GGDEF)-like protein
LRPDRSPAPESLLPRACAPETLPFIIDAALAACRESGSTAALLWIELEHIKTVNESVLEGLSMRIRARLRSDSQLIRAGGDGYLAVVQHVRSESEALAVAMRLLEALEKPCTFGADEVTLTASIGISLHPVHGADGATLLRNAQEALDTARLLGGAQARLYRTQGRGVSVASREISLRNALERSEFQLLFQPQVDTRTGGIAGTEVLLTWQHPELGRIPAHEFIPLAESTKLIRPIGIWVLREACKQAGPWIAAAGRDFTLAVNVSAVQFATPEFLDGVAAALKETGFRPESLELEITETVLLREAALAVVVESLEHLRRLGIRIALDDFGAGYSSLAYLRNLPLDTLKIDRSFLIGAEPGSRSAVLVAAMAAMGRSLGLRVVAEGVETGKALTIARDAGCDLAQGYFFGGPMDSGNVTALLLKR